MFVPPSDLVSRFKAPRLVPVSQDLLGLLDFDDTVYMALPVWPDLLITMNLDGPENLYLSSGYAELVGRVSGCTYRAYFARTSLYVTVKTKAKLVSRQGARYRDMVLN